MLDQQCASLTVWVEKIKSDDLLVLLIGCSPNSLPPLGSYYDFINRLWLSDSSSDKELRQKLAKYPKDSKPKGKAPGKNKRLPNKHPDIVRKTVDYFISGRTFDARFEGLLQRLFLIAVVPSMDLGLIPNDNLTIAGDGTCVHTHPSSLGSKVCQCKTMVITPVNAIDIIRILIQLMVGIVMSLLGTIVIPFTLFLRMMNRQKLISHCYFVMFLQNVMIASLLLLHLQNSEKLHHLRLLKTSV